MEFFPLLLITFITGLFTKLADEFEDRKLVKSKTLKVVAGVIYGSLIGYVIVKYPVVAPLWIGTVIGATLIGKIDALSHYVAMSAMVLVIAFFGINAISIIPLLIFALVCTTEEFLHEIWVTGKKIKDKTLVMLVELRPLLELTAFIYSAVTGYWSVWLALLTFDIGYVVVSKIAEKGIKNN